jgi:putative transcriptional regulator
MKNRLRLLRQDRRLSQADLARLAGVSRQTINAIETGRYDPGLPLAFTLAGLFSLRIEEIFEPAAASSGGRSSGSASPV